MVPKARYVVIIGNEQFNGSSFEIEVEIWKYLKYVE